MPDITRHQLSRISELISVQMGLHFPEARWSDLERGICSAATEFEFEDTDSFIRWLTSTRLAKNHIETLASHLTVGETYFFREREGFDLLEERIIPALTRLREKGERRIRIWSAGCSTGEEPYSIAILASRVISDLKDWNITILATDINPRFLRRATEGVYTEWSFRGTPQWIKDMYFRRKKEGHYEIIPQIREMVEFKYLNLAEDAYPSLTNNTNAMDIIICRNVLMYFSPDKAKKVVHGFYNSLVDKGWLLAGPTDIIRTISPSFVAGKFPNVPIYRKEIGRSQEIEDISHENIPYIPSVTETFYSQPSISTTPVEESTIQSVSISESGIEKADEPDSDQYSEANLMFEQGRYADAAEILTGLYQRGQDGPAVTGLLAKAYANQGRLEDALKWCEKAISEDVINPGYYYLLATILMEQGRIEDAVKSLKKTLYLDHDFTLAYFMLGNLMRRKGEYKASRKYFHNAADLLSRFRPEEVLPESEGITAGRLSEIIVSMTIEA